MLLVLLAAMISRAVQVISVTLCIRTYSSGYDHQEKQKQNIKSRGFCKQPTEAHTRLTGALRVSGTSRQSRRRRTGLFPPSLPRSPR